MSTDVVTLHRATDADWPSIWPIWHEVVAAADTYCFEPGTTSDAARALWIRDADRDETWLARTGDRVVGTYHVGPNQNGPGGHVVNASYMVDASVRGAGVGRTMVEHSLRRTAELGFLGMQFNAVVATNVGAIGLYERLGFAVVGRVPGAFRHPRDGRVDLVVMYRELTPSP